MEKTDRKAILKKYFAGECSTEEKQIIEHFLLSEDNASLAEYLKSEWENTASPVLSDDAIAQQRYLRLSKQIGKHTKRPSYKWVWIAASILILLMPLLYIQLRPATPTVKWATVTTKSGQRKKLILADGSEVWLNAASSITYPLAFSGQNRKVEIKGEAFFHVTKNKHKPFIVAFNHYYTQVLGTSFNIKAFSENEHYQVTVVEGRVAVGEVINNRLDQHTILHRNESASLALHSNRFVKNIVDADQLVAWKKGEIRFHLTKLPTVIADLSRWYNADIRLADTANVKMPSFTLIVKPGTSLDDVLYMLSMTNKIAYKRLNNQIIISPK